MFLWPENLGFKRFCDLAKIHVIHYFPETVKVEQPSSSRLVYFPYMQYLFHLKSKTPTLFQRLPLG